MRKTGCIRIVNYKVEMKEEKNRSQGIYRSAAERSLVGANQHAVTLSVTYF